MKREKFLAAIFADWPAKVLSLAVALLLTLFYNLTRLEQRTVNIPLVVSINDEMAPSSQFPRMVRVILRGERDVIYGIREDEISASIDLSSLRSEGVHRVAVRLEKRGNALSADPLEIRAEPSEIAVGLERRTLKRVPVTPAFKGFLEPGYELTSFDVQPPEVTISGPAGAVARTTEVSTDTIELAGKRSDFSAEVRLVRKDTLISLVDRDTVSFTAKVKKSMELKTFANLAITVKGLAPSLVLAGSLPAGNARLYLPGDSGKTVDGLGLLSIDLAGITEAGSYPVEVKLDAPPDAVVEAYDPQNLTVELVVRQFPDGIR